MGDGIAKLFSARMDPAKAQLDAVREIDRVSKIKKDYGDTDFARQMIEDKGITAHYAPEAWTGAEEDEGLRTSQYNWNASRAQWNDLSDADKQIAVDDRKMALLDYDKRIKERQALMQVSKIMDQREQASKSAGSSRRGGGRPLTGGYGSVEPMGTPGAKEKLGL